MATYPLEKILADYEHGRMEVEMALGHSLQHIGHLYTGQTAAQADRQALHKQVNGQTQVISQLQDEVIALKRIVVTLQTAFDHVTVRAKQAAQPKGQPAPADPGKSSTAEPQTGDTA